MSLFVFTLDLTTHNISGFYFNQNAHLLLHFTIFFRHLWHVFTWTGCSISSSEGVLMLILPFSPQEMSSDVKETFCHSFSFAVATEQQADIDERYLSCAHTCEGPPEWSPQWIPLPRERRGPSHDRPTNAEMHKWWAQITHCTHYFLTAKDSSFFLFPPSPSLC